MLHSLSYEPCEYVWALNPDSLHFSVHCRRLSCFVEKNKAKKNCSQFQFTTQKKKKWTKSHGYFTLDYINKRIFRVQQRDASLSSERFSCTNCWELWKMISFWESWEFRRCFRTASRCFPTTLTPSHESKREGELSHIETTWERCRQEMKNGTRAYDTFSTSY